MRLFPSAGSAATLARGLPNVCAAWVPMLTSSSRTRRPKYAEPCRGFWMHIRIFWSIFFVTPVLLLAQDKSQFQQILDRLDTLERENHELTGEVHALREEIAGLRATPPGEAAPLPITPWRTDQTRPGLPGVNRLSG